VNQAFGKEWEKQEIENDEPRAEEKAFPEVSLEIFPQYFFRE